MSDLDTIRERHREHRGGCAWCGNDLTGERDGWPCDTRVVLEDADRLAEQLQNAIHDLIGDWDDGGPRMRYEAAREALRQHEGSESVPIVVGLVGDQMERAT